MRRYPNLPDDATTQAGRDYLSVRARSELRRARDGLDAARRLFLSKHLPRYVDLLEKFQTTIDHWEAEIAKADVCTDVGRGMRVSGGGGTNE